MEVELLSLVMAAFFAGLVDAVAGGGGLIQVPALLGVMPQMDTATLFGTNKLSSVFGTASATWRYVRRVTVPFRVVVAASVAAFVFSFVGAALVSLFPAGLIRPVVFGLLVAVVIYTLWQPDLGVTDSKPLVVGHVVPWALLCGAILGFYDGFFGPGTGSFLIFCFVRVFGFDFLRASVSAKVVNLSTNVAALSFFVPTGHVLWVIGFSMAVANVLGAQAGAHAALRGGSKWVRWCFILMSCCLILKVGASLLG